MTTSDESEHHRFNPSQDHLSECDACQKTHLELMDKHVGPPANSGSAFAEPGAGSPLRSESPEAVEAGSPPVLTPVDKMRAKGWTVAVHNDYRLNGRHHTFWLFTNGDYAAKGEGSTDDEAIEKASVEADRIVATLTSPEPPEGWEWEEDGLLTDHVRELTLHDADTLRVETSAVVLTIPIAAIEALTGRRLVKTVSPNQDPE